MATKPDVCWQLPLRKEDNEEDDGTVTTTLSEFARSGWGPAATSSPGGAPKRPKPSPAPNPVYRSMEVELRGMVGDALYEAIAAYLDRRMARRPPPTNGGPGNAVLVPHPALRKAR